jgi:AcrR family transcriptional regulator
MNALVRRARDDVRNDILAAAQDLFRELGARATVGDVAQRLGMSSANIYRFFPSKQALTDAVCANYLVLLADAARAAAAGPGGAGQRVRATFLALRAGMLEQMLHEARMHELVDLAINENWPAIDAFYTRNADIIAALIAEGQANGEFGPGEPGELARRTMSACVSAYHPALIGLAAALSPPALPEDVIDFALRALANREPAVRPAAAGGGAAQ